MQTGFIYHYTLLILVGTTVFIGLRQMWLLIGYAIDFRLLFVVFVLFFYIIYSTNNEK